MYQFKKNVAIYSCIKYVTTPVNSRWVHQEFPFVVVVIVWVTAETIFECKIEIEEEVRQRTKLPYFKTFHNLRQLENAVKKKAIMNTEANLYCHFYTHVFKSIPAHLAWQGLWWFHDIPCSVLITLTIWFSLLLNILQDM